MTDTPAPVRARAAKRGLLDFAAAPYLRIFSAAGIVWFHTAPNVALFHAWGGIGVGLFLLFAFLQPGQQRGLINIRTSWNRLLIPFIGWSLVYILVGIWMARGVWAAFEWPAIHLWFVPFIFVGTIVVRFVREIVGPFNARLKACLALAAALCVISIIPIFNRLSVVAGMYWISLGSIGLGLAYGFSLRLDDRAQRQVFFAIPALVAVASVPIWLSGQSFVAISYNGGTLLMTLCTVNFPRYRFILRLSRLTFGIFLAHPLAHLVVIKVVGVDTLNVNIDALLTFLLAGLTTWTMLQTPYLRRMV